MKQFVCILLGLKIVFAANSKCSMQWHQVANTTFQYHFTRSNSKHGNCEAECGKLGKNVTFATVDETILRQMKRWRSVMLWVSTKQQGCNYALNRDILLSRNCSYELRCLCQRQSNTTVNKTQTIHDRTTCAVQGAASHESITDKWINITGLKYEYLVTKQKGPYDECTSICAHHDGTDVKTARMNASLVSKKLLDKLRGIQTWIFKESEANKSVCHFAYRRLVLTHKNCHKSLHCLCQQLPANITASKLSDENKTSNHAHRYHNTGSEWVQIKERQYFTHSVNVSFARAVDHCKYKKAALVSFTNPMQYILLPKSIQLNGDYWVGGGFRSADGNCLALQATDQTSLKSEKCETEIYSICSRVANASDILNHPAFVKLIANMTLDVHQTKKTKRKLISADDDRTSVKALGSVIGVGVIAAVGSLLILNDVQTLRERLRNMKGARNKRDVENSDA